MNIIEVWQVADYNESKLKYYSDKDRENRGKNG